jgi:hypothetical protein
VELFFCKQTSMRLTMAGCARLFLSTRDRRPRPGEGRRACVGCQIGVVNAGGQPAGPVELAAEIWKDCCSRCQISGSRLVGGHLCVSCYNRDREAAIGKDRKGRRPVLADAIHPMEIVMTRAGEVERLHADRVLSAAEMMVAAAKATTSPMVFGWSAAGGG